MLLLVEEKTKFEYDVLGETAVNKKPSSWYEMTFEKPGLRVVGMIEHKRFR